jgi:AcrR family transcriptional regulator
MKQNKTDRRSLRTRQLLSTALVELMLRKRYDEITVQDIIDQANVGRSTFYSHYLDKEDLLESGFASVLDEFSRPSGQLAGGAATVAPDLTWFFSHVQTHRQLYISLVRAGATERLFKKSHAHLRQNIELYLRGLLPNGAMPALPLPLVADYMAGAILTMLNWWLANDMPYPPEAMNAMFHQLVLPGVSASLPAAPHS